MADKKEALEWAVIPPSSATRSIVPDVDHDYHIFDAKIGAALAYGERRFGVNLVWGDPATSNNVRLAGFIPDCIVLCSRLFNDPRVPRRKKAPLVALAGYLALPFDLVPDFIPTAGQLDDVVIVALVVRSVLCASGAPLVREHWPTRQMDGLRQFARAGPPPRDLRPPTQHELRGSETDASDRVQLGKQTGSRRLKSAPLKRGGGLCDDCLSSGSSLLRP